MDWNELLREYGWTSGPAVICLWLSWKTLHWLFKPDTRTEADISEIGKAVMASLREGVWTQRGTDNVCKGKLMVSMYGRVYRLPDSPANGESYTEYSLPDWERFRIGAAVVPMLSALRSSQDKDVADKIRRNAL